MRQIKSISLQNFQVFGELTRIPLARLSMFFGPNSAGKSSVIDALQVMQVAFPPGERPDRFGTLASRYNATSLLSVTERHWRQLGPNQPVPGPLAIHICIELQGKDIVDPDGLSRQVKVSDGAHLLEVRLTQVSFDVDNGIGLEAFLDGRLLFRFLEHVRLELPIEPLLVTYRRTALDALHKICRTANPYFKIEDGCFVCTGCPLLEDDLSLRESEMLDVMQDVQSDLNLGDDTPDPHWAEGVAALSKLAAPVLRAVAGTLSASLELGRVPASRTVPSATDVTFDLVRSAVGVVKRPRADDNRDSDSTYLGLACGLTAKAADGLFDGLTRDLGAPASRTYGFESRGVTVADNVNRALRDHLLIDRSYQVRAEVTYLFSSDAVIRFADRVKNKAELSPFHGPDGSQAVKTRLTLADATDRRYSFHEVGSGIGYVLPVLVVGFSCGFASIEQPELHLHPALQAGLGDVLIDAINANPNRQLLVETHSEHLLLRILKRLRQSSRQTIVDPTLRLSSDDVSIVYFDPLPSGHTRVINLRVSEDGEFLDRWPHGFFAERDRELFDE